MPDWLKMFDGRLEVQPPLTDEQLAGIPAKRGVVLLAATQGTPIVLLTAADLRARTRTRLSSPDPDERRKAPDLRNITREILWKLAWGHFEADLSFLELACAIWPREYAGMPAWRPAWFVHVDSPGACPRFARTREVFGGPGRYFGPFADGRSAERFIGSLQDAFDLCRQAECLRKAPHGPPCAYSQMGKCLGVGDGRTSMDQYRLVLAKAADFAAGRRKEYLDDLRARMKAQAAALQFEQAAATKSRMERLAELDAPAYAHVAPAEEFRFLLVQPSQSPRRAKVFLVDRGSVDRGDDLDYPPRLDQVRRALEQMARHVAAAKDFTEPDRWRMGLVSHYLYSSDQRRGVMLRWRESMPAEEVASAMEAAAKHVRWKAPAPPRTKKVKGEPGAPPAG